MNALRIRRMAHWAGALLMAALCASAHADEAQIRKNLSTRLSQFPKIEEVSKTPVAGLYEVRTGNEVMYTDEQGNFLVQGNIIDTRTQVDLTEERVARITAIDFASLPLADAMVFKQGTGKRRVAVFVDPRCGYCKRFERDLTQAKDVTIYTFLYPVLGPDSATLARELWCSAGDRAAAWRAWMLDGRSPAKGSGKCDDAALARNKAFGEKHRVRGTPAVVFEDGMRIPGAMSLEALERRLAAASKKG